MAAVVGVFVAKVPFGNATPGGFIGEIWRFPTAAAGDTMALTAKFINRVVAVVGGGVEFTVLAGTGAVAITLLDTIAASNFVDVLILGYSAP